MAVLNYHYSKHWSARDAKKEARRIRSEWFGNLRPKYDGSEILGVFGQEMYVRDTETHYRVISMPGASLSGKALGDDKAPFGAIFDVWSVGKIVYAMAVVDDSDAAEAFCDALEDD